MRFLFPLAAIFLLANTVMGQAQKRTDVISAKNCSCADVDKTISANKVLIARNKPSTDNFKQSLLKLLADLENMHSSSSAAGTHQLAQRKARIATSIKKLDTQYDHMYKYETDMTDLCALRKSLIADGIVKNSEEVTLQISKKSIYVNGNALDSLSSTKYISLLISSDNNQHMPTMEEYARTFEW